MSIERLGSERLNSLSLQESKEIEIGQKSFVKSKLKSTNTAKFA